MNISAPATPVLTLSLVISALRGSVFGWWAVFGDALGMRLHRRLGEIALRMERLMARFLAGTLRDRAPRVVEKVAAEGGASVRPARVWPYDFGWLLRLKAHHAALYHHRLLIVLGEPDMVALLEVSAQARRLLGPLCRMLGVPASVLRPGRAAVEPKASKDVKKRVRKPRPPVFQFRTPFPRGILSAARRAGFGKVD